MLLNANKSKFQSSSASYQEWWFLSRPSVNLGISKSSFDWIDPKLLNHLQLVVQVVTESTSRFERKLKSYLASKVIYNLREFHIVNWLHHFSCLYSHICCYMILFIQFCRLSLLLYIQSQVILNAKYLRK